MQKYLTWDFQSGVMIVNFLIGKISPQAKVHQSGKFAPRENNPLNGNIKHKLSLVMYYPYFNLLCGKCI